MVSFDSAVVLQCPGQRNPQAARGHAGERHRELNRDRRRIRYNQRRRRGGKRPDQQRSFPADDDETKLCRQCCTEGGENDRRRAAQRVLPREPGAEGPLVHVKIEVSRVLARQGDENPECRQGCRERERRNYNVFGRAP